MRSDTASETAIAAGLLRAAHQVLDEPPRILEDPISVGLVPGSSVAEIEAWRDRLQLDFLRVLRASFVARSRIAEDALFRATAGGVAQYVLLGAGYDTFAYRQPAWAGALRIFELDHPASQEDKVECLRRRGLERPANLRSCPIDFEREELLPVLERAGFVAEQPSFFSWLGVIPYLGAGDVESTLRAIFGTRGPSTIALSYVVPDSFLSGPDARAVSLSAAAAARRGEPWRSRYAPGGLEHRIRTLGYTAVEHFGPRQYRASFFAERSDGLPTPSFERVLVCSDPARGGPGPPAPA